MFGMTVVIALLIGVLRKSLEMILYIDVFFHNDQDIELKFTSNNLNINGFMNCSKIPEVLDSISLEEVFQTFLQ